MADYLVQEDGTSKFALENSSGDLLLEAQTTVAPPFIASVTTVYAPSLPEVTAPFIASVTAVYTPSIYVTGDVTLTAAGTYTWLCPPGVTLVDAVCYGGGGGGGWGQHLGLPFDDGGGGGGGGAYAERVAVPVTPGTTYTIVVGAGGAGGNQNVTSTSGGDSTFTGDSSVQVVAKGGNRGIASTKGTGGSAASSTGDSGLVFSGGDGGAGTAAPGGGGAGGGASGDVAGAGANGSDSIAGNSSGQPGGTGVSGGGSGGNGGPSGGTGSNGSAPGGGGGGGAWDTSFPGQGGNGAPGSVTLTHVPTSIDVPFIASNTTLYGPQLYAIISVSFISSVTSVYTPIVQSTTVDAPFIASVTVVYAPEIANVIYPPFIPSVTVVYTPSLPEVEVPFIASRTHVWGIFSLFDPNRRFSGPGDGGEAFALRLAPNGVTVTASLTRSLTATDGIMYLAGDSSLPSIASFVVTVGSEVIGIRRMSDGTYRVWHRALSNTLTASHSVGSSVAWNDSYDMAIEAGENIDASFTADIDSTGTFTYPGWLVCFDSSQAYLSGDRYPMHVTEVLGVFDAGAGSGGTNRCDGPQPNAISTPLGVSDDCPAALANPARIATNIATGDVALVRYTNPEATALDLGPRATSLQSWFGLKRVDASDSDVTFTDPDGYVVDTIPSGPGPGPFTGSVNGQWPDPVPEVIGIAPDASQAAGYAVPTPNPVPWTTVTLPGSDRYFTDSIHFNEKGWPMCCLSVRQGNRRVPYWQSWDWHNYSYTFTGFGTDATFAQILINRNGIVFSSVPEVELPGPQDIDGPDVVWDDGTYFFGASWYVVLFSGPYIVAGPVLGGGPGGGGAVGPPPTGGYVPIVTFPTPGTPVINIPTIEGGSGGGNIPFQRGLHIWQRF